MHVPMPGAIVAASDYSSSLAAAQHAALAAQCHRADAAWMIVPPDRFVRPGMLARSSEPGMPLLAAVAGVPAADTPPLFPFPARSAQWAPPPTSQPASIGQLPSAQTQPGLFLPAT